MSYNGGGHHHNKRPLETSHYGPPGGGGGYPGQGSADMKRPRPEIGGQGMYGEYKNCPKTRSYVHETRSTSWDVISSAANHADASKSGHWEGTSHAQTLHYFSPQRATVSTSETLEAMCSYFCSCAPPMFLSGDLGMLPSVEMRHHLP